MKFMLMMHGNQGDCAAMATWSPAEVKAHIEFMLALVKELTATGELLLAEGLDWPPTPRVVRALRADAPIVSDGPFAETKEFLAGFWLVEVPSRERAIAIAAKASTAPGPGGMPIGIPIEVRQVMSAPQV
jgi:hypothetical protein